MKHWRKKRRTKNKRQRKSSKRKRRSQTKKREIINYSNFSATELIEALYNQERHPDLELIEGLLNQGDEIVPALIDIVDRDSDWPRIHAALLLCELRTESALPVFQRHLSGPDGRDLTDWLVDDALAKFGPVALDMLESVAAEKTALWFPRASACRVMVYIAYLHPETYPRVAAFLRGLLPDPDLDWQAYESYEAITEAVDDPQIWSSAVARLCNLRDPEAYDLIGRLFEAGLVDEMYVDPASYRQAYQESTPPPGFGKEPISLLERYKRSRPRK